MTRNTIRLGLATTLLAVTAFTSQAAIILEPVDTIYVPARSIAVTGRQSADLVGLIYSRDNLYFNDPDAPRFLFFDKEGRVALGIGGAVRGMLSYDFDGALDDPANFTTYDIAVPNDPARRQAFGGDVSHSSIFLKLVGRTTQFGYYSAYIQTNFAGKPTGSYDLRLKQAYLTLGALTAGLTNSTFVDVTASLPTIDEEGPSGAVSRKQVLFRYNPRIDARWSAGIGVELPGVSFTVSDDHSSRISQRVPDIPGYIQYRWNGGRSHVRVSALLRTFSYRNLVSRSNRFATGWGVQLSGVYGFAPGFSLYYQGVYGAGIGNYLNDLAGNGLDLVYTAADPGRMRAPRSLGLVGGLGYTWNRLNVAAGWSMARLYDQSHLGGDTYRRGQYVSVNAVYNIIDDLQCGVEYLWGQRKNVSGDTGHANRLMALLQFSF